jgi:hypothetical protein
LLFVLVRVCVCVCVCACVCARTWHRSTNFLRTTLTSPSDKTYHKTMIHNTKPIIHRNFIDALGIPCPYIQASFSSTHYFIDALGIPFSSTNYFIDALGIPCPYIQASSTSNIQKALRAISTRRDFLQKQMRGIWAQNKSDI